MGGTAAPKTRAARAETVEGGRAKPKPATGKVSLLLERKE